MANLNDPDDMSRKLIRDDRPSLPSARAFERAMASGDLEKQLIALRNELTYRLQTAASRDVAAIGKELREVVAALQDVQKGEGVDPLELSRDDVARRFAELESRFAAPEAGAPADGDAGGDIR